MQTLRRISAVEERRRIARRLLHPDEFVSRRNHREQCLAKVREGTETDARDSREERRSYFCARRARVSRRLLRFSGSAICALDEKYVDSEDGVQRHI